MTQLWTVAGITLLAAMSPGPDFAMVTRQSFQSGRRYGMLAALGIAAGVQVHVFYTVFGISWLLAHMPQLLWGLRVGGAVYLTWLGYRMLATASAVAAGSAADAGQASSAFLSGFLTNAVNPKTTVFVISTLTQLGRPDSRWGAQLGSGAIMSLVHLLWFALVALLFSRAGVRARLAPQLPLLERLIGAALFGLGLWLVLANLT